MKLFNYLKVAWKLIQFNSYKTLGNIYITSDVFEDIM